ncbi:MAG: ATP-binding cassette domain-containing protein [Immundisolibacterales bacterium]|nr:ATP-binding cassette domain-containing protein [Immundisolibacterales bacterium]
MSELVRIENLVKHFGPIKAVDGVSFSVARGEVLGFLGPNGAGKSTTMKVVTGFLSADSGRVSVGGEDIAANPIAAKRRIGYLPEGAPLYSDMTTRAFLEFTAAIRGFGGEEKRRRVADTVTRVALESVLEQPIETLSKGFKRRVGLAQSILHDPEVLVLDEPTDGLDPNQKHEVRSLIREMAPRKAIVLSTHLLEEVDAVCTRAVIISAGRIVSDGTPEALHARAAGHNAVTLVLRGVESEAARAALAAAQGVRAVEELGADGGAGRGGNGAEVLRLRILPEDGRAVAAEVSQVVRERGWKVEELTVDRGRLEDVFRSITAPDRTRS